MLIKRAWIVVALSVGHLATPVVADPGDPIAVRRWGGESFSVETMWGLTVFVGTGGSPGSDISVNPTSAGDATEGVLPAEGGAGELLHLSIDRVPNTPHVSTLHGVRSGGALSSNAVTVLALTAPTERAPSAVMVLADGVTLLYLAGAAFDQSAFELPAVDVLIASSENLHLADRVRPRLIVPLVDPDAGVPSELAAIADSASVCIGVGNTVAIADGRGPDAGRPRIAILRTEAWQPQEELAALIDGKGRNSDESQRLFASMTAEQISHKPANGTHTPRWNAEHMMGRDLLFFSSIYSHLDDAIVPIDLNPAQMPPDYVAAHPDWTGAEEARQMERVHAFTERFAYLLADTDLDELPKGAPVFAGSLRGLFRVMGRHYPEHTENVRKKMLLDDWPAD